MGLRPSSPCPPYMPDPGVCPKARARSVLSEKEPHGSRHAHAISLPVRAPASDRRLPIVRSISRMRLLARATRSMKIHLPKQSLVLAGTAHIPRRGAERIPRPRPLQRLHSAGSLRLPLACALLYYLAQTLRRRANRAVTGGLDALLQAPVVKVVS